VSLDPALDLALRAGLALLFATSALAKLRDLGAFADAVAGYRLLPAWLVGPAAAVFAAAEGVLAAALFVPALRVASSLGAASVLLLYGVAIAVNLARGRRDIDCGCGGPSGRQTLSEALVLRNALLAAAALASALPPAPRVLGWLDAPTVCGAVATASLLYAAASQLLARPAAAR
jgi:hypothetical protein